MTRGLAIISLLAAIIFFSNLGGPSIYILDEAKNAGCAREMLEADQWVVPTFNYKLRAQKPPLHYYFMALGYRIFGVTELGARFFSAIFGILTVLTTFLFARRFLGERVAFLSSIVLLSSLHVAVQFHLAVPDPYLIFFVTLSILSFYATFETTNQKYLWLAYTALGLGVMAKGPVALVIVGMVTLLFLLATKSLRWPVLRGFLPWWGITLFVLIAAPWYVAVTVATDGEWLQQFLFRENVSRFLEPMEGHGGPFWIIPLLIIAGMFPFSMLAGQAIHLAWRNRSERLLLLALLTVLVVVVFFSLSGTKLPTYVAPAFPFLAIILGYFLNHLFQPENLKKYAVAATVLVYALLMVALPVGVYLGLETEAHLVSLRDLAFCFLLVPVFGLLAWWFAYHQQVANMISALALSWIALILLSFCVILPRVDQLNPITKALEQIPENREVVSYKRFNPAFSFYLQRPIRQFSTLDSLQQYLNQHEAFIITREQYSPELDSIQPTLPIVFQHRELFEPVTIELRCTEATKKYSLAKKPAFSKK